MPHGVEIARQSPHRRPDRRRRNLPVRRRRRRGRARALAGASRRRAAHVAEDASRPMRRDVRQFLAFLTEHLGGSAIAAATRQARRRADVRAFMAARRADGIGSRSLMRALAGARSFARFLERNGKGKVGALSAVRAPKIAQDPAEAARRRARRKRIADTDLRAGEEREPWILARDAAVLALLYGSGLRISEALGLTRRRCAAPGKGDAITVTGKGNKTRMVPVLPQVLAARSPTMSRSAPTICRPTGRCSSAPRAARCRRASSSSPWSGCAARSACPTPRRRMRCAIPSRRICWRAAATCARSRNCSATPRSRPRRSIPRSTPSGCSTSTAARIRGRTSIVPSRLASTCAALRVGYIVARRIREQRMSHGVHAVSTKRAQIEHARARRARGGMPAQQEDRAADRGDRAVPRLLRDARQERADRGDQRQGRGLESWAFFQAKTIRRTARGGNRTPSSMPRAPIPPRRRWRSRSKAGKDRGALQFGAGDHRRPQGAGRTRQGGGAEARPRAGEISSLRGRVGRVPDRHRAASATVITGMMVLTYLAAGLGLVGIVFMAIGCSHRTRCICSSARYALNWPPFSAGYGGARPHHR